MRVAASHTSTINIVPASHLSHTSLGAGVLATTDVEEACKDVAIAVMVGGFPRKAGMERKDVMSKNVSIYKSQAVALEKHAAKDVKARPRVQLF